MRALSTEEAAPRRRVIYVGRAGERSTPRPDLLGSGRALLEHHPGIIDHVSDDGQVFVRFVGWRTSPCRTPRGCRRPAAATRTWSWWIRRNGRQPSSPVPGPALSRRDSHLNCRGRAQSPPRGVLQSGGAEGIRTPDLLIANETRYQLRHSPLMRRNANTTPKTAYPIASGPALGTPCSDPAREPHPALPLGERDDVSDVDRVEEGEEPDRQHDEGPHDAVADPTSGQRGARGRRGSDRARRRRRAPPTARTPPRRTSRSSGPRGRTTAGSPRRCRRGPPRRASRGAAPT